MIEITNLNFSYHRNRPIFENVSFKVQTGIYGLLGENGVGKTTLLDIISGLKFPKTGYCKVLGYESYKRLPDMLSQIFYLPEEFEIPSLSLNKYIKYNAVFYPNFNRQQLDEYLIEFQIDGDEKLNQMSFGQKKKAMIAFALSLNTPITLLDEPTNGLDIPSKAQFRKIIAATDIQEKCIIISTHQVRDLEHLIDPIIILDKNQTLLNNSVEEITNKLYFGYSIQKPSDYLFCDQILQGYSFVKENTTQQESTLNIEALFNTVITNKDRIKNLFNL